MDKQAYTPHNQLNRHKLIKDTYKTIDLSKNAKFKIFFEYIR